MGQDASANLDPLTENINMKKTGTVSLIQLFTVVRTDTTLDLSQKAEKVSKQTNKQTNEHTKRRNGLSKSAAHLESIEIAVAAHPWAVPLRRWSARILHHIRTATTL